jgi:acylphosphatase
MIVARHVVFRGRVQGVGFRVFVQDVAVRNRVEGWVRNRRVGTVEAVLAGPPEAVDAVIASCRNGPGPAQVDSVDQRNATTDELALHGDRDNFVVLPTI